MGPLRQQVGQFSRRNVASRRPNRRGWRYPPRSLLSVQAKTALHLMYIQTRIIHRNKAKTSRALHRSKCKPEEKLHCDGKGIVAALVRARRVCQAASARAGRSAVLRRRLRGSLFEMDVGKPQLGLVRRRAVEHDRQLARVVIAPHRGLAARHLVAGRNVVPAVRAVINRVQNEPFVRRVGGKIRLLEKRLRDRQPRLIIARRPCSSRPCRLR